MWNSVVTKFQYYILPTKLENEEEKSDIAMTFNTLQKGNFVDIAEIKELNNKINQKIHILLSKIKTSSDPMNYDTTNNNKKIVLTVFDKKRYENTDLKPLLHELFLEIDKSIHVFKMSSNVKSKIINRKPNYFKILLEFESNKNAGHFIYKFLQNPVKGFHFRNFLTPEKFELYKNVKMFCKRFSFNAFIITKKNEIILKSKEHDFEKTIIKSMDDCYDLYLKTSEKKTYELMKNYCTGRTNYTSMNDLDTFNNDFMWEKRNVKIGEDQEEDEEEKQEEKQQEDEEEEKENKEDEEEKQEEKQQEDEEEKQEIKKLGENMSEIEKFSSLCDELE